VPPLWPGLGQISKSCPKVTRGVIFLKIKFMNFLKKKNCVCNGSIKMAHCKQKKKKKKKVELGRNPIN
jgi:hypothetical protein